MHVVFYSHCLAINASIKSEISAIPSVTCYPTSITVNINLEHHIYINTGSHFYVHSITGEPDNTLLNGPTFVNYHFAVVDCLIILSSPDEFCMYVLKHALQVWPYE